MRPTPRIPNAVVTDSNRCTADSQFRAIEPTFWPQFNGSLAARPRNTRGSSSSARMASAMRLLVRLEVLVPYVRGVLGVDQFVDLAAVESA